MVLLEERLWRDLLALPAMGSAWHYEAQSLWMIVDGGLRVGCGRGLKDGERDRTAIRAPHFRSVLRLVQRERSRSPIQPPQPVPYPSITPQFTTPIPLPHQSQPQPQPQRLKENVEVLVRRQHPEYCHNHRLQARVPPRVMATCQLTMFGSLLQIHRRYISCLTNRLP